ncbi:hypothetical protein H2200_003980 [Cladophialophora chaetospira]|uniref:Uncharacterized protein n=1 Tax=Cladophialophora chaetospira TaxID=386627 RepID=A0AA38XF83_9EURO|nr:hypothetical protein H2200_003980 [Cladophialophora chaetospira]
MRALCLWDPDDVAQLYGGINTRSPTYLRLESRTAPEYRKKSPEESRPLQWKTCTLCKECRDKGQRVSCDKRHPCTTFILADITERCVYPNAVTTLSIKVESTVSAPSIKVESTPSASTTSSLRVERTTPAIATSSIKVERTNPVPSIKVERTTPAPTTSSVKVECPIGSSVKATGLSISYSQLFSTLSTPSRKLLMSRKEVTPLLDNVARSKRVRLPASPFDFDEVFESPLAVQEGRLISETPEAPLVAARRIEDNRAVIDLTFDEDSERDFKGSSRRLFNVSTGSLDNDGLSDLETENDESSDDESSDDDNDYSDSGRQQNDVVEEFRRSTRAAAILAPERLAAPDWELYEF